MKPAHHRNYQLDYESCVNEIVDRSKRAYDHFFRTKTFYRVFVSSVIGLSLYSLVHYPLLTIIFFFISYVSYHISFMIYHSSLHAQFIEIDHKKLLPGPFIAFVHHYVNPKLLCCWEHRVSYQSFIILITLFPIFSLCFLFAGKVMIPFVATFLLWHLSSSPVHEWYHTPPKARKDYFNHFEYAILSFLEKLNLISTRKHINHHRHQLKNKHEVIEFDDMNIGKRLSGVFDWLWRFSWHNLYKENKKNLTIFYTVLYLLSLIFVSGIAVVLSKYIL